MMTNAQQKKMNDFVINGHIDGIENDVTIYLVDIDGQRVIDSGKSISGSFSLTGKVGEPTACWRFTGWFFQSIEMFFESC